MKLKKINENDQCNDVREVEKDVLDNAALTWNQSDVIMDYDKKKKSAKKELAVILDNAADLVKKTAPEEDAPKNVVNEGKLKEEPELQSRFDARKSFYGKAKEEEEDGKPVLYSYGTKVAEIDNGYVHLLPSWNYSQTTLRHVKEFLKQHGFRADSAKQMERDYINATFALGESHENKLREEGGEADKVEGDKNVGISGVINALIIDEWEAVDGYNAAIATLEYENGSPDILDIFNDIVTEEMVHIGQLEKALTLVDQNADAIKDGEAEAAKTIDDTAIDDNQKFELGEPTDESLDEGKAKEGKKDKQIKDKVEAVLDECDNWLGFVKSANQNASTDRKLERIIKLAKELESLYGAKFNESLKESESEYIDAQGHDVRTGEDKDANHAATAGKAFVKTVNSPIDAQDLFDELEGYDYQDIELGDDGVYVRSEDYYDALDILSVLEQEARD